MYVKFFKRLFPKNMKYKKVYVNYKVELLKKLFFKKANI